MEQSGPNIDFTQVKIYAMEPSREHVVNNRIRLGKAVAALTMTAISGVAVGTAIGNALYSPSTEQAESMSTEAYPNNPVETCTNPSLSDYEAVDTLLSKPRVTAPDSLLVPTIPYTGDQSKLSDKQIAQNERAIEQTSKNLEHFYFQTLPKEYGVTIHKLPDEYFDKFNDDEVSNKEVLQLVQQYLTQFGIDLQVMTESESAHHQQLKSSIPDASLLASNKFRRDIIDIAQSFENLPVELVKSANLKHIWLVSEPQGFAAYAETGGAHDTVVVAVGEQQSMNDTIRHELTHLLDTEMCGSTDAANNDPSYESINGTVPYTEDVFAGQDILPRFRFPTRPLTYQEVFTYPQSDAATAIELPTSCDVAQEIERDTTVFTPYAYTNVVEDKAELGVQLLSPYTYGELFDTRWTKISAKSRLLMARMHKIMPNVAAYFIALGERPLKVDRLCEPVDIDGAYLGK